MEKKYRIIVSDYPLEECKGKIINDYDTSIGCTRELTFEEMVKASYVASVSVLIDYMIIDLSNNYVLTDKEEEEIQNNNKDLVIASENELIKKNTEECLNFIEIFYELYA